MILIWLKKEEEFQNLCKGKAVFYKVNDGSIHYFTPTRVNEVELLYAYNSKAVIPFREHHDFEDADGVHVEQLVEIDELLHVNSSD